jgi:hypothetical protein
MSSSTVTSHSVCSIKRARPAAIEFWLQVGQNWILTFIHSSLLPPRIRSMRTDADSRFP